MIDEPLQTLHEANTILQQSKYTTQDSWVSIGETSYFGRFYTVGSKTSIQLRKEKTVNGVKDNRIYLNNVYLNEEGVQYIREVYNGLDVLGDLGGILEITMIVFGFFLFPYSEHSYIMQASRTLFFARSKDSSLFDKSKDPDSTDKLEKYNLDAMTNPSKELSEEMSKHHIIKLSLCDYVSLFFANVFKCLCCKCCFKKKDKLTHLYEESQEKLEMQLDIVKIVQNM